MDFRIIHKRSLYWAPVIGLYLYFGRPHRDRPQERRSAPGAASKRAAARIRGGHERRGVPRRHAQPRRRLQPFKRGSFVLALEAGVPVVPVSLVGVKALVPRGLLSMRPGTVRMRFIRRPGRRDVGGARARRWRGAGAGRSIAARLPGGAEA